MCIRRCYALAIVALLLAQFSCAIAQNPPSDGATVSDPETPRTVYVPYAKLRETFEKDGRGVFLPYSEFQALWDAANRPVQPAIKEKPPAESLITSADNLAQIENEVVRVEANLKIELIKKGWVRVPLRLRQVAIQSATIDDQPARLITTAEGDHQLLMFHEDDQPKHLELKLVYAAAFQKAPGNNSLTFQAPITPVNRWKVRIAQPGVKITVDPSMASSSVSGKDSASSADADNETVVLAFVGTAPQVSIHWTPKAEGATGLTALASVQSAQDMTVTENVLRSRTVLRYDISRAALNRIVIEVPTNTKITNVFDSNVRKWEVETAGEVQRVSIELFEPATISQSINLETERPLDADALGLLQMPVIRAVDAARQQGTITVTVDPTLRAEVRTRTGLFQSDAADPASASPGQKIAFRYSSLPLELSLSLTKVQPRIVASQVVTARLDPDQLSMEVLATFDVAEAGVFQFEFQLPAGMSVREVRGVDFQGTTAAAVDAYHVDGENKDHLVVNLANKALGKIGLLLRLEQRLNDPNLLAPTGTASIMPIKIPRVQQEFLKRLDGVFLLVTPESLRVNPQDLVGLRPISISEALQSRPSALPQDPNATRYNQAFAYRESPASFQLSVERRKPYITARQRLMAQVEAGVIHFESKLIFDVQYSGVTTLRVDVPTALASEIRNETGGIRESTTNPQPDDVPPGMTAWTLTGQSELIGQQVVVLKWDQKLEELAVGKTITVDVPQIAPKNVDRSWAQIVLTKAESLDVQPVGTIVGLRPIDPQHDIMPDASVPNAARAFEAQGAWSMQLALTRYLLEEIKHTSIERGLVRMVLTRSNQLSVQALYRLRSSRQRLTIVVPENAEFDSQPARINGSPVVLERGDKKELTIPMVGHDPDKDLILELRYTLPHTSDALDLPQFPEDPAVQKVYVNLFVPQERSLIAWSGPWNEEWSWTRAGWLKQEVRPNQTDEQLSAWVTQGISLATSPPFQRDGTIYTFSTLKPEPAPTGSLKVTTWNYRVIIAIAIVALVVVAIAMLHSSFPVKILAIGCVIIALTVTGAFAPSMAAVLLSAPVVLGLIIVGSIWTAWHGWQINRAWESYRQSHSQGNEPSEASPASSSEPTSATPSNDDQPERGDRHE